MTAVLAATASVMKRISNLACLMECWMLPNDSFFLWIYSQDSAKSIPGAPCTGNVRARFALGDL